MRPTDNFFWWAEVEDMPSRSMVLPLNWPPDKGARPVRTEGRILQNNRISLRTGASSATVWLSPEMVNFAAPISVSINGRSHRQGIAPSTKYFIADSEALSEFRLKAIIAYSDSDSNSSPR